MTGPAEPGRLIGGRYRLLARLGSGGMGRVWRASDEALRIEVALKEVWLPAAPGPDADERLRRAEREARNAARLRDHPNVVAVHDVVVEDGVPWTVMQLVAGHTLEEHVEQFGPLSVTHAALVAGALLDALEAAHAAGIVHRDVKPANVMLADDGKVLLTDFGIALANADTALTAAGSFLGSVEYIAPERARGTEGLPASDLFSLGVTLFQAVEGFSPFHRETATGTLTAVILDEAPAPVRAGRLTPLVTGLLEKDPAARVGIADARRLVAMPETPAVREAAAAQDAPTVRDVPTAREAREAPVATAVEALEKGSVRRPGSGSARGTAAGSARGTGSGSARGTAAGSAHGTGAAMQASGAQRRLGGTAAGATAPRGAGQRGPGTAAPRQTGPGHRPSQGTDQRRRIPAPDTADRSRRQPPMAPARPRKRRPRGLILLLLVAATIGGVVIARPHHGSFDVTTVKTGDFVRVDDSGHITGKLPGPKARNSADGRRVTAKKDGSDPTVCEKSHALGRPDVEHSVSFCLVRPAEEGAAPAQ